MKLNVKLIVILLAAIISSACTNEVNEINGTDDNRQADKDIVFQEEDPNALPIVTKHIDHSTRTKSLGSSIIGNSDVLLGRGYKVGNSILGDFPNVGDVIIDIDKVKAFEPNYITGKILFGNETRSFAYSDDSRYESNSTITKKKSKGFNINIAKIFSFGRKKKTTETFSELINTDKKRVYGELTIDIRNSLFTMSGTAGARKIYSRQCLATSFIRDLYSTTLGDIQENYGHFVLGGYYTGGRAFAMYAGLSSDEYNATTKETNMDKDISASFTYKTSSGDGSLAIGRGNNSSSSNKYINESMEVYIKTLGGSRGEQGMSTATKLEGYSINLTTWVNSLKDVNTHTIIDIADGGLYPLSAFVMEDNFKRRFDDTSNGLLEPVANLYNPRLEILPIYVRTSSTKGDPLYEVAAVLTTRQGDKIVLNDGSAINASDEYLRENNNRDIFMKRAQEIGAQKRNYFVGMQILMNASRKLNPSVRNPYVCIRLTGFDETQMFKYRNPDTDMEYIYNPSKKIALSYFIDEGDDDTILDYYKIRDWVESIPTKDIPMSSLALYKIIGL